jgi:hypothetical protein
MIETSSSFRHKTWRRFYLIVLGVVATWVLASAALTVVLNVQLSAMKPFFRAEALTLDYAVAYVNIFEGAVIRDLSCRDDNGSLWRVKRLEIGFNVASVFNGQIIIKNIEGSRVRLDTARLLERLDPLQRIVRRLNKNVGFFSTTYIRCNELWLGEDAALRFNGYFSTLSGGLYVSKGEVALVSVPFLEAREPGVLTSRVLADPFDYLLDIEIADGTWKITRFEMTNAVLRCLGTGTISDTGTPQARVDLSLDVPHLLLDDLPLINKENIQTRGLAELTLSATGPLDRLEQKAVLRIVQADMQMFDSFSVRKINGSMAYENCRLSSSGIGCFVNQVPLEAHFSVVCGDLPHIVFDVVSVPRPGSAGDFTMAFDGDWTKERRLRGDLSGTLGYLSGDLAHRMTFLFKGFNAGIDEYLFVTGEDISWSMEVSSQAEDPALKKDVFRRTFFLEDLFAVVRRQKDGFSLEPLKAGCYGGTLEGRLLVDSSQEVFGASAEVHLRDVDLHAFAEKTPGEISLILGRLDGDLKLDTRAEDIFRGQLFVTDGVIEQNSLLNAVADFLGVASLKRIAFGDLSVFFNGGRGDFSSKVTLTSDDVSALLEGDIQAYETMDGYLSVVMATSRLNESKQFKRLLTYIKHDQPSVTFPFKISSYLKSPRVLWLKNEFKEKLTTLLPERNQRYLQKQINSMVEGIKTE